MVNIKIYNIKRTVITSYNMGTTSDLLEEDQSSGFIQSNISTAKLILPQWLDATVPYMIHFSNYNRDNNTTFSTREVIDLTFKTSKEDIGFGEESKLNIINDDDKEEKNHAVSM